LKRILVVTNMYPSEFDVSWRGIFIEEQIKSLMDNSVNLKFDLLHVKGRLSGGTNFNYVIGLYKYLWLRFRHDYDFIWAHHSFCVFLASIVPLKPIVYSVHEGFITGGIKYFITKLGIAFSDYQIFVNSRLFRATNSKRSVLIPCGVNLNKFLPIKKGGLGYKKEWSSKNFNIFFPADPKRPEKNCTFVLNFISEKRDWLEKNRVEFHFGGNIEREDMMKWIASSDCVVCMSNFESDGMVIKEAMACDIPVISFNVGNASWYLHDNEAGTIIRPDNHEFLEAIRLWKSKGRSKGRSKLTGLGLSDETVAKKIEVFFNEVV